MQVARGASGEPACPAALLRVLHLPPAIQMHVVQHIAFQVPQKQPAYEGWALKVSAEDLNHIRGIQGRMAVTSQ